MSTNYNYEKLEDEERDRGPRSLAEMRSSVIDIAAYRTRRAKDIQRRTEGGSSASIATNSYHAEQQPEVPETPSNVVDLKAMQEKAQREAQSVKDLGFKTDRDLESLSA